MNHHRPRTVKDLKDFVRSREDDLPLAIHVEIGGLNELVYVREIAKFGGGKYPGWYLRLEPGNPVETDNGV